jgi:hypothetical protein
MWKNEIHKLCEKMRHKNDVKKWDIKMICKMRYKNDM